MTAPWGQRAEDRPGGAPAARERPGDEGSYLLLLRDVGDAVATAASLDAALATIVDTVAERLGYDVCSIYLATGPGDAPADGQVELVLRATHGLAARAVGVVRMRPGEGLTGLVAESERALFTSRADEHPRFKFFPETGEERYRSFGGVPLLRRGRCLGVLTVQTVEPWTFPPNEVVALEALALQVVSLIDLTRRTAKASGGPRAGAPARGLLVGLGTSAGVGVGAAVRLGVDPLDAPPPARPWLGLDEEWRRFLAARDVAAADLDARADALGRAHGPAAEAIMRAQAELVRDPGLEDSVRALVEGEREPVERAVHRAVEGWTARLRAAMADKAADFRDVRAALLRALAGASPAAPAAVAGVGPDGAPLPVVVVADALTPAETAQLDAGRVVAIVTRHGSETSHASILARSLGIPAVVGVPDLLTAVAQGDRLLVDGDNGFVFHEPAPEVEAEYAARQEVARAATRAVEAELERRRPAGRRIRGATLLANIGLPHELGRLRGSGAEGVGLLRTEFFYLQRDSWPTAAEQEAFLRRALVAAPRGGPVVVRLLDAGGDKALPYADALDEPNPILGLRSVRYLLAHEEVARAQVEALLRAAEAERADVRILVPLVTARWELEAVRALVTEASERLGVPPRPVGMMVEAPSVLYQLDHLVPLADFVSLGTNDLTQYLLAVDRDNERVRGYYSAYHPAVLRAVHALADSLAVIGKPVSVCGEMAGDPLGALALLALGVRSLSARPRALPPLECLLHCVGPDTLEDLRPELLAAPTPLEVERLLRLALRAEAPALLDASA